MATLKEAAGLAVAAACQGSVVTKPYPPGVREIEVSRYKTDFSAFRSRTGWAPKVPLQEGIARTVAFYRERLGLYL